MTESPDLPQVSVVIATYDRPDVLATAIESVRNQSLTDWELIVVGDAANPATEDFVRSVDDPRVSFVNLGRNTGEQSGPNNYGVAVARGTYIAFLNQDDIWFPDHLELSLEAMRVGLADWVFAPNLNVLPPDNEIPQPLIIDSLPEGRRYSPTRIHGAYVASGWLVRRQVLLRLRGWRPAAECRVAPSQDLLFRGWRAGLRILCTDAATVITFPSGIRSDSYLSDGEDGSVTEQRRFLDRVAREPGLRARLISSDPVSNEAQRVRRAAAQPAASRWLDRGVAALALTGLHPAAVHYRLRRGLRPGEFVQQLRSLRGLDAVSGDLRGAVRVRYAEALASADVTSGETVTFDTDGSGARHLLSGWGYGEDWGVWNDGTAAELVIRTRRLTGSELTVVLKVRPHLTPDQLIQRVVMTSRFADPASYRLDTPATTDISIRIPVRGRQLVRIRFDFPDAVPGATDPRVMALGLESLTVTAT